MSKRKKRQARRTSSRATASQSREEMTYGDDFNPDYSYVIKDLRRIGALAGTFFVVLIILSFFLN